MKRDFTSTSDDDFFLLSGLPPSPFQVRLASAVVLCILVVAILVMWPLSGMRIAPIAAIFPMYLMAMFLCDSITATLLFSQFSISRSLANLVIASGYLFTAITIIPYSLTFPGVFASEPIIGHLQSTAWLFDLWHIGFPLFVIAYGLLKDADSGKRLWPGSVHSAIGLSFALIILGVSATAVLCVVSENYSPTIILDTRRFSPLFLYYVAAPVVLASLAAIIVLWVRRRSLLDLWLMVVLFLYVVEMPISFYPDPECFSLGWTAARILGFFDSSVVLVVLLYEITYLYFDLLRAVRGQRREREARLMTGDAVAAAIAQVFDPLFTTKAGGKGLGLSICRLIVEAYDGKIWVRHNEPRGVIFEFAMLTNMPPPAEALSASV